MQRRAFLKQMALAPVVPMWGFSELEVNFWDRPRYIDLQRKDTGERFGMVYFRNGMIDAEGYRKACEVLRDAHVQQTYPMDIRLLDLICATQAWIRYYGYNVPYLVHSGYRSPKTNGNLEGAARNSKHMSGQALDFTVPGVPPEYMGRLAHLFLKTDGQGGGVGFYTSQHFTHMDTGRGQDRVWTKK